MTRLRAVLILVLLMATFGKVRPALLIFANVPMSVSGGILAVLPGRLAIAVFSPP